MEEQSFVRAQHLCICFIQLIGDRPFSFCQYPFLMSMGSKLKILQADTKKQMRQLFIKGSESPYLLLSIRRDNLVADSLEQIESKPKLDLKKKLKVSFVGEEGLDAGGLAKEWLLLLTRELFLPQYGISSAFMIRSCLYIFSLYVRHLHKR